nr:PREDICTED: regulator of G-protein signaling 20 [Equus przewalskii]
MDSGSPGDGGVRRAPCGCSAEVNAAAGGGLVLKGNVTITELPFARFFRSPPSPAPTLEEVSAWAQSFDKLMLTPAGRNAFREFLRTEFSEENMLFWMACEELKKEANKNIIEEKARIIYEDYVSILSPKEVSLDSRVREVINRNMVEPSQHIFDDAQLQIYTLMHRDSYPRFMNSALYKDLLQSLSEKSVEA